MEYENLLFKRISEEFNETPILLPHMRLVTRNSGIDGAKQITFGDSFISLDPKTPPKTICIYREGYMKSHLVS